eukprot:12831939-Ditylum_brightwellii.AAC.1
MAWSSWTWWRHNTIRQHEWQAAIDRVTEMSAQIAARRVLISCWSQHNLQPSSTAAQEEKGTEVSKESREAYQTNKSK